MIQRFLHGLRSLFARRQADGRGETFREAVPPAVPPDDGRWTLRRWDSAKSTRLNQAHWQSAQGQTINTDLQSYLENLRTRSSYEAANNPHVEGVIFTHQVDVVGANGPALQVQSDNAAYNEALEKAWRDWWKRPVLGKRLSGIELLRLWVRDLWLCGELLAQKTYARDAVGPIKLRLKPIHARRLATPPQLTGDPKMALGVERDDDGEPVAYHVSDPVKLGAYVLEVGKFARIPAADVIHEFLTVEADQARGIPWMAPGLDSIADLRDYDAQVLDAARQAADQAIYWYTTSPDIEAVEVNESVEIERRTQSTGPPGYQPMQLIPQQPSTQYLDYRGEKLGELGRPVNMPRMMVRLTAENHNYSSARFDGQIYLRGLQTLQGWLATAVLDDLVDEIAREAALDELARAGPEAGAIGRRPDDVRYEWTWPVPPHVDPKKEADAERIGLENGTLTYGGALAARGQDVEATIQRRARENRALEAAGLPPLPRPKSAAEETPPDDDEDDDEDETEIKAATKTAQREKTNGRA